MRLSPCGTASFHEGEEKGASSNDFRNVALAVTFQVGGVHPGLTVQVTFTVSPTAKVL